MTNPDSEHQGEVGACKEQTDLWTNQPYGGAVDFGEQPIVGQDPVRRKLEDEIKEVRKKIGGKQKRAKEITMKIAGLENEWDSAYIDFEEAERQAVARGKGAPGYKGGGKGGVVGNAVNIGLARRRMKAAEKELDSQRRALAKLEMEIESLSKKEKELQTQIEARRPQSKKDKPSTQK